MRERLREERKVHHYVCFWNKQQKNKEWLRYFPNLISVAYKKAGIKECEHSCIRVHILHLFFIGQWLLWNWWLL